jgi:sugar O-acyltransferase (sialic acid O-acetyltransferase NeuD family)
MKTIAIYGASGFGSEVLPLVRGQYPDAKFFFIDDSSTVSEFQKCKVWSLSQFLELECEEKAFTIAIANSDARSTLRARCIHEGLEEIDIRAANTVVMDNVSLGSGAILCPFVTLTSNIRIGKAFHANIYSYVGHDCIIGDFVTFAPSVKCNGNVIVEDHVYIGTGAIIKQGTPEKPLVIGSGAIVGMGAVVTKSVPAKTTVIGNPAKPLTKAALRGK